MTSASSSATSLDSCGKLAFSFVKASLRSLADWAAALELSSAAKLEST